MSRGDEPKKGEPPPATTPRPRSGQAPRLTRQTQNGATLIVVEEHSLPIVRFLIATRHGAGHDPDGAAGALRQMLELMLRGTRTHTRRAFHDTLEELGSSLYAAGSHEAGFLRGISLTRHLETTFLLAVEALTRPVFDAQEHRRLIAETIAELRSARDDDDEVAEHFLARALYPDHPFARSAAGEIHDLNALTKTDVETLFRKRLAADELVIGFAGDIDPQTAGRLATTLTAALPATLEAPLLDLPDPLEPPGMRVLVVDKKSRSQTQLRVGCLTCAGHNPSALPFWLGAVAFGGTFTSPFTHAVREERGWSYTASASFDRWRRTRAPFVLRTAPKLGDAFDCLALEMRLIRELAAGELSDDAIERARAYLLNRHPFQTATAADLLAPAIACELLGRPLEELQAFPELLGAVSKKSVREALCTLLDPDRLAVVLVAPADEALALARERFPSARVDVVDYREGLEAEGGVTGPEFD